MSKYIAPPPPAAEPGRAIGSRTEGRPPPQACPLPYHRGARRWVRGAGGRAGGRRTWRHDLVGARTAHRDDVVRGVLVQERGQRLGARGGGAPQEGHRPSGPARPQERPEERPQERRAPGPARPPPRPAPPGHPLPGPPRGLGAGCCRPPGPPSLGAGGGGGGDAGGLEGAAVFAVEVRLRRAGPARGGGTGRGGKGQSGGRRRWTGRGGPWRARGGELWKES